MTTPFQSDLDEIEKDVSAGLQYEDFQYYDGLKAGYLLAIQRVREDLTVSIKEVERNIIISMNGLKSGENKEYHQFNLAVSNEVLSRLNSKLSQLPSTDTPQKPNQQSNAISGTNLRDSDGGLNEDLTPSREQDNGENHTPHSEDFCMGLQKPQPQGDKTPSTGDDLKKEAGK